MPKIIRVRLSTQEGAELNRRGRERNLTPRERERLEIVRLSDMGHTIPAIARSVGRHEQTVRAAVKAFNVAGFAGLRDAPHLGRQARLTEAHLVALERVLDESAASGESWTLRRMVTWLHDERGVSVSQGHLSSCLKARGFRWKRTYRSLRHKQQSPDLQASKEAELEALNL